MLFAVTHARCRCLQADIRGPTSDVTDVEQVDVDRLTGVRGGSTLKSGIANCVAVAPFTGVYTPCRPSPRWFRSCRVALIAWNRALHWRGAAGVRHEADRVPLVRFGRPVVPVLMGTRTRAVRARRLAVQRQGIDLEAEVHILSTAVREVRAELAASVVRASAHWRSPACSSARKPTGGTSRKCRRLHQTVCAGAPLVGGLK